MKNPIILFLLAAAMCGCTQKNNLYPIQNKGTLTGYDLAQCDFCGGIKITIQNDISKNPPAFYRIDSTLTQLGINENTAFPINVQLTWHRQTGSNPGNYIVVSKITQTP